MRRPLPRKISFGPFSEPTPAMPEEIKVLGNSIESYRNYYIQNKAKLASWKNRQTPFWYKENTNATL